MILLSVGGCCLRQCHGQNEKRFHNRRNFAFWPCFVADTTPTKNEVPRGNRNDVEGSGGESSESQKTTSSRVLAGCFSQKNYQSG